MIERLQIRSYFSIETDLAASMSDWPEFVAGSAYDVDLRDQRNGETVGTRFVIRDEDSFVVISSSVAGPLFDKVVGKVVYALSAHSDNLMINRIDR